MRAVSTEKTLRLTHNTVTRYLFAQSLLDLVQLLHETLKELESEGQSFDDIIVGDFESSLPTQMGGKWYPLAPSSAGQLVWSTSFTI